MAKTDIQKDIKLLNPVLQIIAKNVLAAWKKAGLNMIITETLRYGARQHKLHLEGKSKLDAGQGMHEFGCAFDACQNIKGKEYDPVVLKKAADIARKLYPHLVWGNDWDSDGKSTDETFHDSPHFQYTYPYTQEQIRAGKRPKL